MFEDNQTYKQFLDEYYTVGPKGYLQYTGKQIPGLGSDVRKILTSDETNYFASQYAMGVQLYLSAFSEIYKILDKKPITTFGDSYKYTSAFNVVDTAIGPGGSTTIFGTPTEPSVATISGITGGVENVIMNRDLHSMLKEKIPGNNGGSDWNWLINTIQPAALAHKIDKWLGGYETATGVHGVDTPALKNIECIDRMISSKAESGTASNYVSTLTDGDIYWDGIGTVANGKIDRSSATTWDAQLQLPTSGYVAAGQPYNSLMDIIDDLLSVAKQYSKNKRYAILTTSKTLNLIEKELSPGKRYDETTQVQQTLNGINTRPGKNAGFDVSSITSCGITMPVFTSEALPTQGSVYGTATATAGHLYGIDLDELFIRVDLPVTYLETGFGSEMLAVNYFQSRALLFTVAQLVCTNFMPHFAIKYIAA